VEDSKFFIKLLDEHTISPYTKGSFTAPLTNISDRFENIISSINNKLEDITHQHEKEVKDEKIKIEDKKRNFFVFNNNNVYGQSYDSWMIELSGVIRDTQATRVTPYFQEFGVDQGKGEGAAQGAAEAEAEVAVMDVEGEEATDDKETGKSSSKPAHPESKKIPRTDQADPPTGGSRRRIKKRRPSRTRRNKFNLKSKSKTKTRKQKKPKLKRKSKKRKGSSRRRSRR
jgi:hypothetical protein